MKGVNTARVEELILGKRRLTMRHLFAALELSGETLRISHEELDTAKFMHHAYKDV
jgi:hypothetical protein